MNREIIYGTGIIIFVIVAVLMMNLINYFSSEISVTWTVAILSYTGAVVVGMMSVKSSKMDAPNKYPLIFGIFAVILLFCGVLLTSTLIM